MFEKALFINPVFPLSRYDDNLSSKPKLSNIGAIALPATKLIAIDENQIAIVHFGFLIKYTEQRRHSDGRIVDE